MNLSATASEYGDLAIAGNKVVLLQGTTTVPATGTYDAGNQRYTIDPTASLAAGATFTVKVKGTTGGVQDLASNALRGDGTTGGTDFAWSFTTPGTITTVAGTGTYGFSGENVAATSANLTNPGNIAVASDGTLYIPDQANHRIRKVVPGADGVVNGGAGETITTVAGSGVCCGFSGDNGAATSAQLCTPKGTALSPDGTTLYIADSSNNRVRKVVLSAGIITTVAGGAACCAPVDGGLATSAYLSHPTAVAVTGTGAGTTLYIADYGNQPHPKG